TSIGGPPSGGVKTTFATVSGSSAAPSSAFIPDTPTSIKVPWCSRPLYSRRRAGIASRARDECRRSEGAPRSARRLIAWGSRKVRTSFRRSSWIGLPMKSAAPSWRHSRAWVSLTTPETATIGTPRSRTGRSWRKSFLGGRFPRAQLCRADRRLRGRLARGGAAPASQPSGRGQAHELRVRRRADRVGLGAVSHRVLPRRARVHRLRCARGVPVPVGAGPPERRTERVLGDGHVRGHPRAWLALRLPGRR